MTHNIRSGPGSEDASRGLSLLLNEWFEEHGPTALFQTCATCHHMSRHPNPAFCHKYGQVPPASVIVTGCPMYSDIEEIPF
jgi:hypothetical protein